MIYTEELKGPGKDFRNSLYLNASELSLSVGECTELACVPRADTDNTNLMAKGDESQKDDPACQPCKKNSVASAKPCQVSSSHQPEEHKCTRLHRAPVQGVTDLPVN